MGEIHPLLPPKSALRSLDAFSDNIKCVHKITELRISVEFMIETKSRFNFLQRNLFRIQTDRKRCMQTVTSNLRLYICVFMCVRLRAERSLLVVFFTVFVPIRFSFLFCFGLRARSVHLLALLHWKNVDALIYSHCSFARMHSPRSANQLRFAEKSFTKHWLWAVCGCVHAWSLMCVRCMKKGANEFFASTERKKTPIFQAVWESAEEYIYSPSTLRGANKLK